MAVIPDMDLATARAALRDDFRRKIDEDKTLKSCIWCKAKKKHPLIDCPNAYPAPDCRTAFANEVINAGQRDVAVAYIHQLQLHQYPRNDNATTFSTGRLRYLMAAFTHPPAARPPPATAASTAPPTSAAAPVLPPAAAPALPPTVATGPTPSASIPAAVPSTPMILTAPAASHTAPAAPTATQPLVTALGLLNLAAGPGTAAPTQAPQIVYENENVQMPPQQDAPGSDMLEKTANIARPYPDNIQRLQALQNLSLDFHARKGFVNTTLRVYTNHFQIQIKSDQKVYKYKIESDMPGRNKRKRRAFVKTAIQTYNFLSNNRAEFATDHFDTIVSWKPLHPLVGAQYTLLNGDGQNSGSIWQLPDLQDDGLVIRAAFTFESMVDVVSFLKHTDIDPAHATTDLEPTKRVLNILVSKCFGEATRDMVQLGANKFFFKKGYAALSGERNGVRHTSQALCTLRGYYYTIKAGIRDVLLNINVGTSAFYRPILVSELMQDRLTFSEWELEHVLKGVRVHIEYIRGNRNDMATYNRLNSTQARVKTIQGLGKPVWEQTFQDTQGHTYTVLNHLQTTYNNRVVQHEDLRAVNLGSPDDPKWYAPEDLKIVPYQVFKSVCPQSLAESMLSIACHAPYNAAALVEVEALRALGIRANDQTLMGLPNCPLLDIDPRMMQVPSHRFPFPRIEYGNNDVEPAKDHWNTKNKTMFRLNHKNFNTFVLVDKKLEDAKRAGAGKTHFRSFAGPPQTFGDKYFKNYNVAKITYVGEQTIHDPRDADQMKKAIDRTRAVNRVDFVLLILAQKDALAYARFKDLADRKYGYHSICITERILITKIGEKMGNIMMKANLKTAGSNHTIKHGKLTDVMSDTLVLGADVTHPTSSSILGCPSIAAIVGSVDDHAGRFLGSMRLQKEGKKEMIDYVEAMVIERIKDWVLEQPKRCLPKNIIYYRDGVSDGQYKSVCDEELPLIRSAWPKALEQLRQNKAYPQLRTIDGEVPKLTAIVCVKRHHVRFYPANDSKKEMTENGNCPSGTHVDAVVTHPYYADFYLQSHAPLQGTARPAHYFILVNEMNKSVDELRQLTHELCFTYVRATSGVSYASPAYYADRLCERGRHYLRDFFVNTPEGQSRRDNLKLFKRQQDSQRSQARTNRYGHRFNANGTRRPKGQGEEDQERLDRDAVKGLCVARTYAQAKTEFYQNGDGKNPWHPNISKTMFWM